MTFKGTPVAPAFPQQHSSSKCSNCFFFLFCFVNIIQIVDEYCLVLMRKRESRSMSDDEEGEGGGGES